ncbi:MAG: RIO1 family regulatory kinase/ATPase, partial [Anaerolineae bacterium]|nr:RIO1 family regulatory kinase/ATPase [Anaerolineae bacterium]
PARCRRVSVPRPLALGDNAMLMEYVGDLSTPAPTLNQVALSRSEAGRLFARLMEEVERMLAAGRVHADLSAYNVLYWKGEVRLIDFPQAIDPEVHPNASPIFRRDVTRLCQHFRRYGIARDAAALADELWARYYGHLGAVDLAGEGVPVEELVRAIYTEGTSDGP